MNKKMTLLAGAICSVLSSAAFAGIDDIIITEYVEGTGYNKAIEITNIGTTPYDFDGTLSLYYRSGSHINQIQSPTGINVLQAPSGSQYTLGPKQSLVVIHHEAKGIAEMKTVINTLGGGNAIVIEAGAYNDVLSTGKKLTFKSMNFSGKGAVWLGLTSDKTQAGVKDIFGDYTYTGGVNPDWTNVTFRRKAASQTQHSSTFDSTQWSAPLPEDTFSGLGHPTNVDSSAGSNTGSKSTASNPCSGSSVERKEIGAIQGKSFKSPLIEDGKYESADEYKVTGVVSAINKVGTVAKGFYLYNSDGDPETSDGLFVKISDKKADISSLKVGQEVCVRGKIKEDWGMTSIIPVDDSWEVTNASIAKPTPVDLKRIATDKVDAEAKAKGQVEDKFRKTLERYEGMLVKLPAKTDNGGDMDPDEDGVQDMRVTRSFSHDYDGDRNNMVLAYKRPNPQPNQNFVAGSDESKAQSAENKDYRLYIESDIKSRSGKIPYYPDFFAKPKDNYIRVDDSVTGLEGVLHYSHGEFRLIATNTIDKNNFVHNTDRKKAPDMKSDSKAYPKENAFGIRIATQNVLNYFNSPFGGADNTHGVDRGAKSQQEFEHQQAKIVKAIYNLNADIIGLMEIENNGFGDLGAINELLRQLNKNYYKDKDYQRHDEQSIQNRYVFVGFDSNGDMILDDQDSIGGDVITTGLIYRPSKVAVISGKVIPMPEQHAPTITNQNKEPLFIRNKYGKSELVEDGNNYQRNTIAATFKVLNTGKRLTVAVNHLKSKGSPCYEDWKDWQSWKNFDISKQRNTRALDLDHQGHCENFRVAAAYQLGTEMAKIKGDKVLLGDMNAYAHEDPLLVLTSNPTHKKLMAAGYTYIGKRPQFDSAGQEINTSFGYLNAVDLMTPKGETAWSYSFAGEIGSLDHLLISPTLEQRLIDAKDSHINAAESPMYDYNNKYKGGLKDNPNPFYSEDPYRSSDHDSAIAVLGYKYNEAGENLVTIGVKSGRADIAYPVPAEAKKGDVATLSISPMPEIAPILPKVILAKDGAQPVMFEATKLPKGQYTLTMTLTRASTKVATRSNDSVVARDGDKVIDSKTMQVDLVKRDSKNVKPTYPESDGSGGAFGLGTLLAMFGFGFLRRRRY